MSVNMKDLLSGFLFVAFGGLGLIVGSGYAMGTAAQMGPAYFPVLVSGLLILIGGTVGGRALWAGREAAEWGSPRPLVAVLAAVLAFTALIEPMGFPIATLALIVLVYIGGWQFRLLELTVVYLILLGGSFLIFIELLSMPLKMMPGG